MPTLSDESRAQAAPASPSEQQLINARVELDGVRSRRADVQRRSTEATDLAERERLLELVSVLDLRIANLEQHIVTVDAWWRLLSATQRQVREQFVG